MYDLKQYMSTPVLYIRFPKFVAVATPHARKQVMSRAKLTFEEFLKECDVDLEAVFEKAAANTCYAVTVGDKPKFLLYIKRRFNRKRRREELECITLTPSRHVKTPKHNKTKLLQ